MLALGCGRDIQLFNADNYECLRILRRHSGTITCIDFSPIGRLLVSAGGDGRLILWDTELFQDVRDFDQESTVWKVHFSNCGNYFVTTDAAACIRKWDVATGTNLLTISMMLHHMVECLLLPDSSKIISCGLNVTATRQFVGFWDSASGALGNSIECRPNTIAISPAGDALAVGFDDGRLGIYQINYGCPSEVSVRYLISESDEPGEGISPSSLIYSSDGSKLGCKIRGFGFDCRDFGELIVWEIASGQELRRVDVGNDDHRISFSPAGDCILTTDSAGFFQVIDICSGESKLAVANAAGGGVFSRQAGIVLM